MSKKKQYDERDTIGLGDYYVRHVVAMTEEDLHEKSTIAAELAFRDKKIDDLEEEIRQKDDEIEHLELLLAQREMQ